MPQKPYEDNYVDHDGNEVEDTSYSDDWIYSWQYDTIDTDQLKFLNELTIHKSGDEDRNANYRANGLPEVRAGLVRFGGSDLQPGVLCNLLEYPMRKTNMFSYNVLEFADEFYSKYLLEVYSGKVGSHGLGLQLLEDNTIVLIKRSPPEANRSILFHIGWFSFLSSDSQGLGGFASRTIGKFDERKIYLDWVDEDNHHVITISPYEDQDSGGNTVYREEVSIFFVENSVPTLLHKKVSGLGRTNAFGGAGDDSGYVAFLHYAGDGLWYIGLSSWTSDTSSSAFGIDDSILFDSPGYINQWSFSSSNATVFTKTNKIHGGDRFGFGCGVLYLKGSDTEGHAIENVGMKKGYWRERENGDFLKPPPAIQNQGHLINHRENAWGEEFYDPNAIAPEFCLCAVPECNVCNPLTVPDYLEIEVYSVKRLYDSFFNRYYGCENCSSIDGAYKLERSVDYNSCVYRFEGSPLNSICSQSYNSFGDDIYEELYAIESFPSLRNGEFTGWWVNFITRRKVNGGGWTENVVGSVFAHSPNFTETDTEDPHWGHSKLVQEWSTWNNIVRMNCNLIVDSSTGSESFAYSQTSFFCEFKDATVKVTPMPRPGVHPNPYPSTHIPDTEEWNPDGLPPEELEIESNIGYKSDV